MISESSPTFIPSHGKTTQGIKDKLKMLLGAIWGLVFLFIIVLSLPVYLFRILVIILAKLLRPDLGNVLNGLSSYLVNDYFYNKKSPRDNIVVSVYLQGREPSIQEFKKSLMEQWITSKDFTTGKLKFEQLQQYPERWLGFTFYKSYANTFDISNHVHLYDHHSSDIDFVNDEDISNICEKLLNEPYKPCTSPWEVYLVKNHRSDKMKTFNSKEKTYVVILKIHHSLADGYSILTALVEGLFPNNLTKIKLPKPRFPKRSMGQNIFYYISLPFALTYELTYFMSHIFRPSPWKIPDEKKEWYQNCSKSDLIPIERVKFIKSKLGVSFTSVLLYTISSAIDKSLQYSKRTNLVTSHVKSYLEEENDVKYMYCMSLLPLPGHSKGLTNHVTMALFDLPIGNNDSVINGLREVDHVLETTRKSVLPLIVPLYLALVGWNFYPIGHFIGKQRTHHTGLTNFPSVPFQVEQNGKKCIAVDFLSGALDGVAGVMVMVLSYGEFIRIAVTAEKAVMSKDEITKFTSYMMDEINHLYDVSSLKH